MERLAIALLCLALPAIAAAQTLITWTCVTDQYLCNKTDQRWSGWYFETLGPLIEQHSDFTFNYEVLPVKRMYKYLNSGKLKIALLPLNTKVYPDVRFAKKTISYGQIALYSLTKLHNFQGLDKLPLSRIVLRRGMNYNGIRAKLDAMDDNINLQLVNNNINIFRLLEKGRADYVLTYLIPGISPTNPDHPHVVLQHVDFHFAANSKSPAAKATLDKLDEAIDRIYSKLGLTYYFSPQDELYKRQLTKQTSAKPDRL